MNWDSFNVGKNATVNFNQPNSSAVTLNRVTGGNASVINGAIHANGQVVLVNENGVVFGKGAQVNAAAVTASTLNIADQEFMDGKSTYKDDGTGVGSNAGKIINKGVIQTNNENGEGGFIALLAPEVRNQGYLLAQKGGTVAIGSGSQITLHIQGQSLVAIKVDESVYNGLITNKRIIEAPGGLVVLATGAANQLMAGVIKNTGRISANSLESNGGVIELVAKSITQAGQVSANSQTKEGGQVNLVASDITLTKNSKTTATGAAGGGQVNIGLASTQVSGGSQVNSQSNALTATTNAAIIKANANQAAQSNQLANTVAVQESATIDTSATQVGNGGSIAIWSKVQTTVAGILKSMGGALSGNGGFIETSSQGQVILAPTASINTSANNPTGKAGTWLLDPIDLIINSDAANVIANALSNNNVTIAVTNSTTACPIGSCTQTNVSGANSSLTIASGADILKSGTNYTTLTLSSEGIFNLNANISGQNLDVIISSSIAYLNVGSSINASKVTVQAQSIYSAGSIQTSNYLSNVLGSNPGSLGNAITLLAQAIYVSGRLSASTPQGVAGSIKLEANTVTLQAGAVLEANGDEGGQIAIAANDSLWSSATVQANGGNGRGGTLSFTAANDQYFDQSALQANGTTDGGAITITTQIGDLNFQNTLIQTNGSSGRGGSIGLSATHYTQIVNSNISANGYSQGGTILIGNDATNGSLPFSMVTTIDQNTTINAAQLDSNPTNQHGGFIETSGHTLNLLATINAGRGGMWLLDPTDVMIDSITASNIVAQLNLGTNVTIQTTATTPICSGGICLSASPGLGDITVSSDIVVPSAMGTGSLTLTAYNNIAINANITLYGNLTLNAQVVNVAPGVTIQLNQGSGGGVNFLPGFTSSYWSGNGIYGTHGLYAAIDAGPVGSVMYYYKTISGLAIGSSYTLQFDTWIPNPGNGTCGGAVANCAGVYLGALWITGANAYASTATPSSGAGISASGPVGSGTGYKVISNMGTFSPTEGVTSVNTSSGSTTQLNTTTDGVTVTANVVALASTMTLEFVVRNDPSWTQVWNPSLVSNSTPGVLTINNSSIATPSNIQGVISGSSGMSVLKQGAGALILGGINTYNGGTTISGGILALANNSALGAGPLSMAAATSLQGAAANIAITNNIALTGNAMINVPTGNSLTISGIVNDGGNGLILAGQGNLTLSNNSNTISSLTSSGPLGNLVIKDSGALTLGSGSNSLATTSMDIETTVGNITIAGNLSATSSSNRAIVIAAGTSLLPGLSTAGSDILISGTPTITTGVGGRAELYTGTLSGSTGFTDLLVPVGDYRYNSVLLGSGYTAALSSGVYLIYREQPVLTIAANNVNMTYGATSLPTISASITGLRNGDLTSTVTTGSSISSAPVYNASMNTLTDNVGAIYTVMPTGYASTLGYGIVYAPGAITMVAAPLTITASNDSKVYGSTITSLNHINYSSGVALVLNNGYTVSGLANGDSISGVTLTSAGGNSTASVSDGPYPITPSALVGSPNVNSSNYTINYVNANLVVTPAPLTVKASSLQRQGGSSFSGGNGVTFTGLLNGDTALMFTGSLTYSGSSQSASSAGTYAIVPGGISNPNYAIVFASGDLVLTPAPYVPTFVPPPPVMVIAAPPPPAAMAIVAIAPPPTAEAGPREAAPPPFAAAMVAAPDGGIALAPAPAAPPPAASAPPPAAPSGANPSNTSSSSTNMDTSSNKPSEGKSSGTNSKGGRIGKYDARRLAESKEGKEGKGGSDKPGSKKGEPGVNGEVHPKYAGKYANGFRAAEKVAGKDGTNKPLASSKANPPREGKYSNRVNALNNGTASAAMAAAAMSQHQFSSTGLPPLPGASAEVVTPTILRGGDSLTQSYDDVPSIRNSGVANAGRSRNTENYHESLESVNLMSTLNLFIVH